MKYIKNTIIEAKGPGTGPEGFLGDISDIETYYPTNGKGFSDPRQSMGAFGSKYQNGAGFKPSKMDSPAQLDQLLSLVFTYLSGSHHDPRHVLYGLKVRLNHAGYDFDFNNKIPLVEGPVSFRLSKFGEKFGTTPTTDLTKEPFDRGADYTDASLNFTLAKDPSGSYYFKDLRLGQGSNQPMQNEIPQQMTAESFYQYIATDEEFGEKVFNPILINLYEKMQKNELSNDDVLNKLSFVVERAAKRLNLDISGNDISVLAEGMNKQLFSEADEMVILSDRLERAKKEHRTAQTRQEQSNALLKIRKLREKIRQFKKSK